MRKFLVLIQYAPRPFLPDGGTFGLPDAAAIRIGDWPIGFVICLVRGESWVAVKGGVAGRARARYIKAWPKSLCLQRGAVTTVDR